MADDPLADVAAVFDVFEAGLVWHCVCAVTRLEVPDRLAGGPLAVPQLAGPQHASPAADRLRAQACSALKFRPRRGGRASQRAQA